MFLYGPVWDAVYHPRLEIQQDCAGDVSRVVGLVEENIFAVTTFGRKVFEVAVLVDPMLLAQLLPELRAHCQIGSASAHAVRPAFAVAPGELSVCWHSPLLPHWPACNVMISLSNCQSAPPIVSVKQAVPGHACVLALLEILVEVVNRWKCETRLSGGVARW